MTLQANAQGQLTGKFTIPANVTAGSKRVRFQGAGGSVGEAVFVGGGVISDEVRRLVTINTLVFWQSSTDPLAQTFALSESAQISAVDLWFSNAGAKPVVVQIRETSNGVPTKAVIAEVRIDATSINTTTHTRVTFGAPVQLLNSVEYALVVLSDDAATELRVAELGKWDAANNQWVTSQPYTVGVLLSSSNASTWSAHQDRDLAFRLHKAVYTQNDQTVSLGSVTVTNATDLMVLAQEERSGSSSTIVYDLTLPDASVVTVSSGQPLRLATAITGTVAVSAKLHGNSSASPVLLPGTQLVVGKVEVNAEYVSRAIVGGASVRVKVVFDAILPAGAGVAVSCKGGDVGDTWTTVPYVTSSQIGDGWMEFTHELSGVNEAQVQAKLTLTGTTAARPRVRNLRFMTI